MILGFCNLTNTHRNIAPNFFGMVGIIKVVNEFFRFKQPAVISSFFRKNVNEGLDSINIMAKMVSKEEGIDFDDAKEYVLNLLAETILDEENINIP